jgi:uncharacterized protein (DUF2235 family)
MNLCLFFEGTGQGVAGNFTNVTRLHAACADSHEQRLFLESGPGTHFGSFIRGTLHGHDWWIVFRRARRWFEKNSKAYPPFSETKVFLFGFSRGALIARHFAAWLDKINVGVVYMGLWDTVDATIGLDVTEEVPGNVRFVRHAIARDETRKLYAYIPVREIAHKDSKLERRVAQKVEELVFPGSHSDVGGLFDDNHDIADVTLSWIAEGAADAGLYLKDYEILKMKTDVSKAVLHDSHGEATNLWGALGRIRRKLEKVREHALCSVFKMCVEK